MKNRVTVEQLKFGMFVCELDRPWTETPFLYQGFVLDNDDQLATLRRFCKSVLVDSDKSLALRDRADLLTSSKQNPSIPGNVRGVLSTITERVDYRETTSLKEELPVALQAKHDTEIVMSRAIDNIHKGGVIDAEELSQATTKIRDSVVRNPGAMMLLSRIKEKSEHILDRAFSVSVLSLAFGRYLQLPKLQLDHLGMAALLQDIGMINIPDEVRDKSGALNKVELMLCRSHVAHSVQILSETVGVPSEVIDISSKHHERFHGSGYPKGLVGDEIGLLGAISGLVDFYDALTRPRSYAETYAPSNALNLIYNARNVLFDGVLAEQFIQCLGIFPLGSVVELNSGEIGIVVSQDPAKKLLPRVMLLLDARGAQIRPQLIINLAQNPEAAPRVPYRIKRVLRQDSVPINPAEFAL